MSNQGPRKNRSDWKMEVFVNHEAADKADLEFYRSLTGNQRLQMMLELMAPSFETVQRCKRVDRIDELSRG